MLHSISLAVQIFATSLLVSVPCTFFIALSRPTAILEKRLHMVGTVICGWQGVKGLSTGAAFPGLEISVREAPGTKCPRCWIHSEAADPETGLCPRCAEVLKTL
jgi:hypothetical protein